MGGTYDGAVVGREALRKGCGCLGEFLHYELDPYRAQRRERFQRKRCQACGRRASDEYNRVHNPPRRGRVKKGREPTLLPAGAVARLVRQADGTWSGTLE